MLNTEASARKHFAGMPSAVIAIEAGARTHCWAQLLRSFDHQVIVANAREFAASRGRRKNDANDAERLARYARLDPDALKPVHTLRRTASGLVTHPGAGCARAHTHVAGEYGAVLA